MDCYLVQHGEATPEREDPAMDDPAAARALLDWAAAPPMLVGHLPHLSRLTSLLLVGDPAREIVSFRMGAIATARAQVPLPTPHFPLP